MWTRDVTSRGSCATPNVEQRNDQRTTSKDGQRAGLLRIARGGENLARAFQRAAVHAAGHRASAARNRVVARAAEPRDRVEQNEDIAPAFHEALGALDAELRDARVGLHVHV